MCVIIVKDNDKVIKDDILVSSAGINPDGLGVVWLDTWEIERFESYEFSVLQTERPFIAHFRYATIGKVCKENTHPFFINEDEVLMQNGSMYNLGSKDKVDGQEMAEIMADIPKKHWKNILELTDNRFVTVNLKEKTYELYNETSFITNAKTLYSKGNVLNNQLVAVYGTLKQGHSNYHNYLDRDNFVSGGKTLDKYPLIIDGLPYVTSQKGLGHNVEVDVMLVNSADFRKLDLLESHPSWYKRQVVPIELDGGVILEAWLYFNDTVSIEGKVLHESYVEEPYRIGYRDEYNNVPLDLDNKCGDGTECAHCKSTSIELDMYEQAMFCWECEHYTYLNDNQGNNFDDDEDVKLMEDYYNN